MFSTGRLRRADQMIAYATAARKMTVKNVMPELNGSPSVLTKNRSTKKAMPGSPGFDPRAFSELNQRFHRVLCQACPNPHLHELLERQWERVSVIRRNLFPFEPVRSLTSVAEHDTILALIAGGASSTEVEAASRHHKLRTMHEYVASPPVSLPA